LSILTSVAFMWRVVNSRITLIATFVLLYLGASKARLRGTMWTLVRGSMFVDDISIYSLVVLVERGYLNLSLVFLQDLCFVFVLVCLFVLAMTHEGTEALAFLAFMRRFFFDASLFLPIPLKSS